MAKAAGLTDSRGNLPLARQNMAYLADALAAMLGSVFGVSTVVTYAESTVGIADGARTGLMPIVTGVCFALAIPFAPIVSAIPPLATGPILLIVSAKMFGSLKDIDWGDFEEAMPAFVTVVTMPFTFNIGYGISAGVATWFAIQILLAPGRTSQGISPTLRLQAMWSDAWAELDNSSVDEETFKYYGACTRCQNNGLPASGPTSTPSPSTPCAPGKFATLFNIELGKFLLHGLRQHLLNRLLLVLQRPTGGDPDARHEPRGLSPGRESSGREPA